ncbi:hypothetical protein CLOM_g15558 [Closterium sp. NIES-68]|nr:hypothetical protein CLOM_g15558 [Closterium sp. NIES-68]
MPPRPHWQQQPLPPTGGGGGGGGGYGRGGMPEPPLPPAAAPAAPEPVLDVEQQKALLAQVMSLTPEQVNALPPDQRAQVLQLQQALGR